MKKILNWNDKEIFILQSKEGVYAVYDYEDNIIKPKNNHNIWPYPDIVKKLYKSNHSKDYEEYVLKDLQEKLGFYCDLQSLNSEDAITWSIFGTLNYFPEIEQVKFINSFLEKLIPKENLIINKCTIQLWLKVLHPDTMGLSGPELDFIIICDKIVLIGENKWNSKISKGQGKNKDKDQIQLRIEFLEKFGKKFFPNIKTSIVFIYRDLAEKDKQIISKYCNCLSISWEDVCMKVIHPLNNEVNKYYSWKNGFTKFRKNLQTPPKTP